MLPFVLLALGCSGSKNESACIDHVVSCDLSKSFPGGFMVTAALLEFQNTKNTKVFTSGSKTIFKINQNSIFSSNMPPFKMWLFIYSKNLISSFCPNICSNLSFFLLLQGEKGAEEADGSKENREDQPSEDQRETSGWGVRSINTHTFQYSSSCCSLLIYLVHWSTELVSLEEKNIYLRSNQSQSVCVFPGRRLRSISLTSMKSSRTLKGWAADEVKGIFMGLSIKWIPKRRLWKFYGCNTLPIQCNPAIIKCFIKVCLFLSWRRLRQSATSSWWSSTTTSCRRYKTRNQR